MYLNYYMSNCNTFRTIHIYNREKTLRTPLINFWRLTTLLKSLAKETYLSNHHIQYRLYLNKRFRLLLTFLCIYFFLEQEPLCIMFCRELRFAIMCGGSTKPLVPKIRSSDDRQPPENGLPFMPLTGFSSVTTKETFSWQEETGGGIPLEPTNDEQVWQQNVQFNCEIK